MKVILYTTMTANGCVDRGDSSASFVSEGEWARFCDTVCKLGNLVVGKDTYGAMMQKDEYGRLAGIRVVVVTGDKEFEPRYSRHAPTPSPQEAIRLLESEGFPEIIVSGGSKLNACCMTENLIDELHLNLESFVCGSGRGMFEGQDFNSKLHLIDFRRFASNGVQIRYKVVKE